LSENGLYTVEGWKVFLSALRPDGLFTVSRWHSPTGTVEIGRVVSLAMAALMELGVDKPREHIYVASVGNLATVIVSRQPFAASDLQSLNEATGRLRFDVLAGPDRPAADPVLEDLLEAQSLDDLNARAIGHVLDLSAPTDARPFFFNQLRLSHLGDLRNMMQGRQNEKSFTAGAGLVVAGNLIAIGTLFLIIALSAVVVVLVVVLPAWSSVLMVDRELALTGSAYFLLIGLGFMFVEIGLIERISVFLGHPVYALSIGLFSIILSTGVGSLLSERLTLERPVHVLTWLAMLGTYLLLLPQWLPELTHSSLAGSELPLRALAAIVVIFPVGLLMGFGFPTGMRAVTAIDARPTPWLWGVNGAAGVLAAGCAVTCSIGFSVDTTIRVGAICYILLLPFALLLLRMRRRVRLAVLA
jgi:hypothetical protein